MLTLVPLSPRRSLLEPWLPLWRYCSKRDTLVNQCFPNSVFYVPTGYVDYNLYFSVKLIFGMFLQNTVFFDDLQNNFTTVLIYFADQWMSVIRKLQLSSLLTILNSSFPSPLGDTNEKSIAVLESWHCENLISTGILEYLEYRNPGSLTE
jgi:hypothetical protein